MATWLTHLRVANQVYDELYIRDASFYFAGGIAPDTNTNPDISHWCINGDKTTCVVNETVREEIGQFINECSDRIRKRLYDIIGNRYANVDYK